MRTVLVVDDEYGVVDVLVFALEDEGYRVMTAPNGKRALECLARNRADLVITDFMMPVMDGQALVRTLRGDPANKDIPIIVMSSVPEPSIRERFEHYDAFLRKPFPIPVLLEVVARLLDRA